MASAELEAGEAGSLAVDVAWSPAPREMRTATLNLAPGATVGDALRAAGWAAIEAALRDDVALDAAGWSAAVRGRSRPLGHALRDGDRVELLRALTVAPMEARRARFREAGGARALRERAAKSQKL